MGRKNSGTHPLRLKIDDNPLDAKTKYDAHGITQKQEETCKGSCNSINYMNFKVNNSINF
jgi:hypothetical protein